MTGPVFSWFFQPPIAGEPGLIMIRDDHPGPSSPEIPFVLEDVDAVILEIESKIPKDLHLPAFRIYIKGVLSNDWVETSVDLTRRRSRIRPATVPWGNLEELWAQRERLDRIDAEGG